MSSPLETLVDAHLAAYCEPDAQARQSAIAKLWHAEGRLVDPPLAALGHLGISRQAGQLLEQFPGHVFTRTTAVDFHHEFARYGWALRNRAGATAVQGVDFLTLDVDGRIVQVVGFFDPPAT